MSSLFLCIMMSPPACLIQCHLTELVLSDLFDLIKQLYDGGSGSISNITFSSSSKQKVANFDCKSLTSENDNK